METDMIEIDSVEVMREKIKAKIQEEKQRLKDEQMKDMESYLLKPVNNLTEDTVNGYLLSLYEDSKSIGFTHFEDKFYEMAVDDLIDLIHLCVIESAKRVTKEEIADWYFNELVNGSTCLDGLMTEDLLYHIEHAYDASIVLACVPGFIKEVIRKTSLDINN